MNQPEDSAMTEVALALAMAFFAIFILTAVSMATPCTQASEKDIHKLDLQSSQSEEPTLKQENSFIVYHQGQYYDQNLSLIDLNTLNTEAQYVLGVAPDLAIGQMLSLKHQKKLPNLSITLLNEQWQQRLESL